MVEGVSLYHRNGYRYEVESDAGRELLPLSKLIAATIHDPTFNIRMNTAARFNNSTS